MVGPAVVGQLDRPQDLQRLDPLLAQPRRVQQPGAVGEVGHREERLHRRQSRQPRPRLQGPAASCDGGQAVLSHQVAPLPSRSSRAAPGRGRPGGLVAGPPPSGRRIGHAEVVQQPGADVVGQAGRRATRRRPRRPSSVPSARTGELGQDGAQRGIDPDVGLRVAPGRPALTIATGMPSFAARSTNR